MNQKKYNALEREYGKFNLKKESFEEIDITDQDELIEFLREKQTRLYDALESKTSGKAIKNKQREIDKIEKFLKQVDQEHEEKKLEETNSTDKGYEKFCKEGKNSPAYPDDINKKIYNFLKEQDLLGHYTVYDKENKCIYDISADCVKIARADMENGNLTISPNKKMIDEIKDAEKKALEETKATFKDEDLVKVYISHNVIGENTIYGEFLKTSEKKVIPLKSFNFEPMDPFIEKMKHVQRVYKEKRKKETEKKEQYKTVVNNQSKNIYGLPEEEVDLEKSNIDNDISMEPEKNSSEEEQDIFHVENNDFDLENLKGNTLIGIGLMNIDGWDPSSLTVTLYDDHSGYISGKVSVEGIKKEIVFGDIDENHNVVYRDDEEIIRQVGVTDRPVESPEAVIVESAEEIGKRYSEKKEPVKKSKWEKPKDIDAYMVIMSQRGEVFATLNSNGEIYKGGKPDHMLYAKSKVGKTIMNSLDEISKISGVDKKDLVVVDGCSYVTTVDGRQVGILSGDGHVISTEYDIKEQQTLYEFANENKINSQGLHIEGHIIYSQDNNPLGYMNKDLESFIGSNEKPEIAIEEDSIIEERNSYMADQMIENGVTVECDEENLDI